MRLSDTYWLSNSSLPEYSTEPCVSVEYGKVRSAGFIRKKILEPILLPDPTNVELWQEQIVAGNIVLMPFVTGSFDPGEPKQFKGYGRRPSSRGPRDQVLTFSDPSYVLNYSFYNQLHRHRDLVPFFRTSVSLHIGLAIGDLFAQNVVEEDMDTEVVWKVACTVRHTSLPFRIDAEPLQELFQQATAQTTVLNFASGATQRVSGLIKIAEFRVGPGALMEQGDTSFSDLRMVGKRLLVMASGIGVPVDYGNGEIDFSGTPERYIEKALGSSTATFINGGASAPEILQFYAYSPL